MSFVKFKSINVCLNGSCFFATTNFYTKKHKYILFYTKNFKMVVQKKQLKFIWKTIF